MPRAKASPTLTSCVRSKQCMGCPSRARNSPMRLAAASPMRQSSRTSSRLSVEDVQLRDGGARERRFVVTFGSLVSLLGAPIIALSLTFAPLFAAAHAAENARKVTVVSFGLYGDQGVFRSEATGAAQIVAGRFGGGPVVVRFNTKTGGGATLETLAATLQAEAKKMNGESDILFVILTSHGSPDGLAVTAGGGPAETLKPSALAGMPERTGARYT